MNLPMKSSLVIWAQPIQIQPEQINIFQANLFADNWIWSSLEYDLVNYSTELKWFAWSALFNP